jgi:hypothetical protein
VDVAVTESVEDIEDQDAVLHGSAKVAEGVRHDLHLAAELANSEVTLDEGPETRIEPQSPGLGIAQKLASALAVLRTRSWRSREIVLMIHERTMLSRHSHEGVWAATEASTRTWSSRA